jgi:hypothetical protein
MITLWLYGLLAVLGTQAAPVAGPREIDLHLLSQVMVGPPRTVLTNQRTQLGGDVEFRDIAPVRNYLWAQLYGPQRVRLHNADTRFAWFDPPAQGAYAFLLTARGNADQTQAHAVRIKVIAPGDVRPNQVILTILIDGEGFVTPGSGVYDARQGIYLTAYGRLDWVFDHWEGPGLTSIQNPLSWTLNANTRIRVVFRRAVMTGVSAREALILTNQQRRQARIRELAWNDRLALAAASQARDMASRGYLGHVSYGGITLADRISREKYRWARIAENIAQDPAEAQGVFQIWMQNPEARQNILSLDFTEMGAAAAISPDGHTYWVQVFARPRP